jgi:hypothetical protein
LAGICKLSSLLVLPTEEVYELRVRGIMRRSNTYGAAIPVTRDVVSYQKLSLAPLTQQERAGMLDLHPNQFRDNDIRIPAVDSSPPRLHKLLNLSTMQLWRSAMSEIQADGEVMNTREIPAFTREQLAAAEDIVRNKKFSNLSASVIYYQYIQAAASAAEQAGGNLYEKSSAFAEAMDGHLSNSQWNIAGSMYTYLDNPQAIITSFTGDWDNLLGGFLQVINIGSEDHPYYSASSVIR